MVIQRALAWSVVGLLAASAQAWTVIHLHPAGTTSSRARGASGTNRVGVARVGGANRASLWSGSAASWVDLHALLLSGFTSSQATGMSDDGINLSVSGYGWNSSMGRTEALVWVMAVPAPGSLALLGLGTLAAGAASMSAGAASVSAGAASMSADAASMSAGAAPRIADKSTSHSLFGPTTKSGQAPPASSTPHESPTRAPTNLRHASAGEECSGRSSRAGFGASPRAPLDPEPPCGFSTGIWTWPAWPSTDAI